MAHWLQAEYRDFHDVPRDIVCTNADGTYFFHSRFDAATGTYPDYYEVYRLPPLGEGETCLSWFGLEVRALERLPDLPVQTFPFDTDRREFLEYDSIAPTLESRGRRPGGQQG